MNIEFVNEIKSKTAGDLLPEEFPKFPCIVQDLSFTIY